MCDSRTRLLRPAVRFSAMLALLLFSTAPCIAQPTERDATRADLHTTDALARGAGLRRLAGKHLVLYTDVPASDEVDELPRLFDLAMPQWADYLNPSADRWRDFRAIGCLMADRDRFARAGLLPAALPPFLHGYCVGRRLWLDEQPSAYYRRHLLLHEGTHAWLNVFFDGAGPPWYIEGLAELLATHDYRDGRMTLTHMPRSKEEAPLWGRIGLIQRAGDEGRALSIDEILHFGATAHRRNEPYAWSWALATFLNAAPQYRDLFRSLLNVPHRQRTGRLRGELTDGWEDLQDRWTVFTAELEYGHDMARTSLDLTPGATPSKWPYEFDVDAARGWQNTGLSVVTGEHYRIHARGRFQVAKTSRPWISEAGGVSIRYYRGRPLGILLAGVRAEDEAAHRVQGLVAPQAVGRESTYTPRHAGTLFLRINDSGGELHDNAGTLQVTIHPPP